MDLFNITKLILEDIIYTSPMIWPFLIICKEKFDYSSVIYAFQLKDWPNWRVHRGS